MAYAYMGLHGLSLCSVIEKMFLRPASESPVCGVDIGYHSDLCGMGFLSSFSPV